MFARFLCLLLLLSTQITLYSQDLESTNIKTNGFSFTAGFDLIAYGRMSDLIEQTGNEDTLGVLLDANLHYIKYYKYAGIEANFKGRVFEPLSHKARFYEDMNPPLFEFTEMNVAVIMKYGTIRVGVLESYLKNIPQDSYFPTLFYAHTVSKNKVTILSGPRDMPIGYGTQFIPAYDTGLMIEFPLYGAFLGFGVVNGEEGLDANSSKGLMAKLSYSNDNFNVGFAGYVTEIGSVPIKEYGDSVNAFFYWTSGIDRRFTVGIEGFWFRHGIRNDNTSYTPESVDPDNPDNTHHYKPGYFTDFSIQTFLDGDPFYAMSGFIFFEAKKLWKFDILTHVGVHDNNIYSDSQDVYQLKYRAFLRITFNVTDDFKVIVSDTFTYDPVFKNNKQYFELEDRYQLGVISYDEAGGAHYTVDNDFYIGVVYTFGTQKKPPKDY